MENTVKCNNFSLYSIDVAKFLCAVSVIGIHTQVFSCFGDLANYYSFGVIFRLSVSFFFVCSGYFFFRKLKFENGRIVNCVANKKKLVSYLKRIFILYLIWSLVYLIVQLIQWTQKPDISFFHLIISFAKSFIVDGSYYHLWYILCLIYAIPIIYFALRKFSFKTVLIEALLLYVMHLIINFNNMMSGLSVVSFIGKLSIISGAIGQTVFIAIPLISIGGYLSNCNFSSNRNLLIVTNIVSLILLIAESSLIYFLLNKTDYSSYIIFSYVTVVTGFVLLKDVHFSTRNPKIYSFLRKMSTLIYCIHPLVIETFKVLDYKHINSILWFIVILIITTVISLLLVILSKYIKFLQYCY